MKLGRFKTWATTFFYESLTEYQWIVAACPCCGIGEFRFQPNEKGIQVNCVTKGMVYVPGLWETVSVCDNPTCRWSKIQKTISKNKKNDKTYL